MITDVHSQVGESVASLAYSHFGSTGGRRIWVLHGIMGSRQNWSRFARRLSQRYPDLSVTTVDLRCHGDTAHLEGPHSVAKCANDLLALSEAIGAPHVLIGHSFGGKVALQYAVKQSGEVEESQTLESVWTLDSPLPARVAAGQSEVARIIETCRQVPMPQPSRQAVTEAFTKLGFSLGIGQWMTTNVRRLTAEEGQGTGFTWRFDISGIQELMGDYWKVDGWRLLEEISPSIKLHLLRAERGMRWRDEDRDRLTTIAPHVDTPLLKDSGHWVHIDQLEALLDLIGSP